MEGTKKMVYVCSPCRGDMEMNLNNARTYCRDIVLRCPDIVPMAPHIYCTQFLDDNNEDERVIGLNTGFYLLGLSSEIWVFGLDKPSEGMKGEIEYAMEHNIPVKDGFKMLADAGKTTE